MRVTWPALGGDVGLDLGGGDRLAGGGRCVLFGIDTLSYKLMVEWLPALWGRL